MSGPPVKRHKFRHLSGYLGSESLFDEPETHVEDEIWLNASIFEVDYWQASQSSYANQSQAKSLDKGKKRDHSSLEFWKEVENSEHQQYTFQAEIPDEIEQQFPQIIPAVPSLETRRVNLNIRNPFLKDSDNRHPCLKESKMGIAPGSTVVVNGYVKFTMSLATNSDIIKAKTQTRSQSAFDQRPMAIHHRQMQNYNNSKNILPYLPPDFGRGLKLDETDLRLFTFYLVGFCGGRTLLKKTNVWLADLAPMATGSECVKHAICALAAVYVLDHLPSEKLRKRANNHYRKGVQLLTKALKDPETHEVGKEDSTVAAIILLLSDDVVHWELRDPKDRSPRWRGGTRAAKLILDHSDPGYRYWIPANVQSSNARLSNANMVAYVDICAHPVTPLEIEEDDNLYSWLLEGTEREVRKIHGGTGVCPKLLHIYAQITHMSAVMKEEPSSTLIPLGAKRIEKRLQNFRQWSELSEGYDTAEELLDACVLNDDGKVDNAAKVTELTGETWVAAAQIYLHCRFYRKPRSHPLVQERLRVGLQCLERMPAEGDLFTSQSPFFPIFLMAAVTLTDEDRKVIRNWFEVVVSNSSARSVGLIIGLIGRNIPPRPSLVKKPANKLLLQSVPPVWAALKRLWDWMGTELPDDGSDDDFDLCPIGIKDPWWERMVDRLMETDGQISLC